MGMVDFYINIYIEENKDINIIFEKLSKNSLYSTILEKESKDEIISIEGKFDNLLPTLILIFDVLKEYKSNKTIIESYGIKEKFNYENVEDFIKYIITANKNKLIAYYTELGYFSISSNNYYKTRNKLKKYYTKLKK